MNIIKIAESTNVINSHQVLTKGVKVHSKLAIIYTCYIYRKISVCTETPYSLSHTFHNKSREIINIFFGFLM